MYRWLKLVRGKNLQDTLNLIMSYWTYEMYVHINALNIES